MPNTKLNRTIIIAIAALAAVPSAARATDYTWTNNGGTGGLTWAPATNWSPAGGPPGASDVAIFANAPNSSSRTVNLGGVAREIDTLRMNETNSTLTYGFSNGSFVLRRFEHNGNVIRLWNIPVTGVDTPTGRSFTIGGTGNSFIDFSASITTHDLTIASKAAVNLNRANSITGTITLASHINVGSAAALGGGTRPIVFNAGGSIQLTAPAGTYASGVAVNGNASFIVLENPTSSSSTAPAVMNFGPLTINGSTLTQNDNVHNAVLTFGSTVFTGNPTFAGAGLTSLGAIEGGTFGLTKTGAGELILRESNHYSGGTTIAGGTLTVLSPTNGLGTGPVTLAGTGMLRLSVPQTVFPTVAVPAGAALGGDLTGRGLQRAAEERHPRDRRDPLPDRRPDAGPRRRRR